MFTAANGQICAGHVSMAYRTVVVYTHNQPAQIAKLYHTYLYSDSLQHATLLMNSADAEEIICYNREIISLTHNQQCHHSRLDS